MIVIPQALSEIIESVHGFSCTYPLRNRDLAIADLPLVQGGVSYRGGIVDLKTVRRYFPHDAFPFHSANALVTRLAHLEMRHPDHGLRPTLGVPLQEQPLGAAPGTLPEYTAGPEPTWGPQPIALRSGGVWLYVEADSTPIAGCTFNLDSWSLTPGWYWLPTRAGQWVYVESGDAATQPAWFNVELQTMIRLRLFRNDIDVNPKG
jgi:hypothetical protein